MHKQTNKLSNKTSIQTRKVERNWKLEESRQYWNVCNLYKASVHRTTLDFHCYFPFEKILLPPPPHSRALVRDNLRRISDIFDAMIYDDIVNLSFSFLFFFFSMQRFSRRDERLKHRQYRLIIPGWKSYFRDTLSLGKRITRFPWSISPWVAAKQKRRDKNAKYRVICTRLRNCFHEIWKSDAGENVDICSM